MRRVPLVGTGSLLLAVVLIAAAILLRAGQGADAQTSPPGAGMGSPPASPAGIEAPSSEAAAEIANAGWFELDRRLDDAGASIGKTLLVGTLGRAKPATAISLHEDSFAQPPVGGLVLFRDDDGETSRLSTVSTADAVLREVVATPNRVVAATLDRSGQSVLYLVAPRTGGAVDLWRQPLGEGEAVQLLSSWKVPELGFGQFQLVESTDGDALVAEFCGAGCDAMYVRLADGSSVHLDGAELGWIVALIGTNVFSVVTDTENRRLVRQELGGKPEPIAEQVDWAQLAAASDGPLLVLLRADVEFTLTVLNPRTGTETPLVSEPLGQGGTPPYDLVGAGPEVTAGTEGVEDWLVVTYDGQMGGPESSGDRGKALSLVGDGQLELREVVK